MSNFERELLIDELEVALKSSERITNAMTKAMVCNFLKNNFEPKVNYFITKYIHENIEKEVAKAWERHVSAELISKMIDAELELKMQEIINNKADEYFKFYVKNEIEKIARKTARLARKDA